MMTTLIVTNDFPPRQGGIETFVAAVCEILQHRVVVLTSTHPQAAGYDRTLPFPVIRRDRMLLPTPPVIGTAVRLLRRFGADRVLFGAAAPLSLMAPALRRAGAERIVALSHGHETWWASVPAARTLLRRMVAGLDRLGTISGYTAARIAAALPASERHKLMHLPPPVDPAFFAIQHPSPRPGGPAFRCVSAGRLVRQKGHDTLLAAWRTLLARSRDAELVIAGDGPQWAALHRQAAALPAPETVRFVGSLPHERMPGLLAGADAFALPMRTRLAGLNPEGLGLAALEAAAAGLPVVVGDSGGAAETVRHGLTGWVVPPDDPHALAARLDRLRFEGALRRALGAAGRAHAAEHYRREVVGVRLREALDR